MQELPIGVDNFAVLRQTDWLYVDKTQRLAEVADRYDWVFLARPRRFGKTLAVSTLEAMFSGRQSFFRGWPQRAGWRCKAKRQSPCFV